MRKLAVVGLVMAFATGVALAGSVTIPYFLDVAGTTWTAGTPSGGGAAGFIGILNTTSSAITVTCGYRDGAGVDSSPTANTFLLPANANISFRPGVNDTSQEGTLAQTVPNSTAQVGSLVMSWTGGSAGDVVCRYLEINTNGQRYGYGPMVSE